MQAFNHTFRFTWTYEEGIRLRDRGVTLYNVSRIDLFDPVNLEAIFYTGYDKICVYPDSCRTLYIKRHSSLFSTITSIKLFEGSDQLIAEMIRDNPGFFEFRAPKFKLFIAGKEEVLEFCKVKRKNKAVPASGEQFDIVSNSNCVCRIQITSPIRSGFIFGSIAGRPIAGTMNVLAGFQEIPAVLSFMLLFNLYLENERNAL